MLNNAIVSELTFTYNQNDQLIEKKEVRHGGSISQRYGYSYYKNGRLKLEENLLKDKDHTEYYYEDDGQRIIEKIYNAKGNYEMKRVSQFQNEHLVSSNYEKFIITTSPLDEERNPTTAGKTQYSYDKNGNQIEEKYFDASGNLSLTISYAYDNFGNLILDIHKRPNEERVQTNRTRYKYGRDHNWINLVNYYETTPLSIMDRKIIYY